jgi:hypothetical protein
VFFATFLPGTLPCQGLLHATFRAGLQVEGVTLHFLNNVFRLNLALEPPQGILGAATSVPLMAIRSGLILPFFAVTSEPRRQPRSGMCAYRTSEIVRFATWVLLLPNTQVPAISGICIAVAWLRDLEDHQKPNRNEAFDVLAFCPFFGTRFPYRSIQDFELQNLAHKRTFAAVAVTLVKILALMFTKYPCRGTFLWLIFCCSHPKFVEENP